MRLILLLAGFLLLPAWRPLAQQPGHANPPFSLDEVQRRHFLFFWELADTSNWQIPDRYPTLTFSSIAATGFGLTVYLVGVERGWITRAQAADRILKTLIVLKNLPQGPETSGIAGYKGFFYHFLDLKNALRFQQVELSTIDTGLLMAGILSCLTYFDADNSTERKIRETADFLYRRVEWDWFLNEHNRLSMGWHPEKGFLSADWRGYNEAMVLVLMAMASPTHPIPAEAWDQWCKPYYWADFKGQEMVNFGPLFGHQYSHIWVDFRGIQDDYMREKGIDYFENSRRATFANRQYCIDNPLKFNGYSENIWGLTACDGPADTKKKFGDKEITFRTYSARGVAADYHFDDGTIAPTAVGGSMPFAPEICLPALEAMWNRWPIGTYGFYDAYNETYTWPDNSHPAVSGHPYWIGVDYLGIDQGPIVLMIENYRSNFVWNLMKKNPYIQEGLKKAGFLPKGQKAEKQKETPKKKATSQHGTSGEIIPVEPESFFMRRKRADGVRPGIPYQLMEPWQAKAGERYPLVVFLHGSGESGNDNVQQMKNGVFAFTERINREKYPCFLLVPQCPKGQSWTANFRVKDRTEFNNSQLADPAAQVFDLISELRREFPNIDSNRIYLTGLSMGGGGTFELLAHQPNLFAAGLPVCGFGDTAAAPLLKNIPIWAFHGALDRVVFPSASRNMVDAIQKAGGNVKYTEYSTLDHSIWNETYYNPQVMEWLFAQKKN